GLERLLNSGRAGDAGGAAFTVEDLVVGRKGAGVAGRGTGSPLGGAALQHDERLAGGGAGELVEQAAAVSDALDVGESDARGVVVGVEVEVVGDRHRGRVPRRDGAGDAHAGGP